MSEKKKEKEYYLPDARDRFPTLIRNLEKISPKTSKILNSKVNFASLLYNVSFVAPSATPTGQVDRLKNAINEYEKAVNETIKGEKLGNYYIEIAVIATTVVFIAVAAIFSNASGIAATSGVSGVTILSQAKAAADTSKVYNHDKTKLKNSVAILRGQLEGCDPNDKACLDGVQDLIMAAFKALIPP